MSYQYLSAAGVGLGLLFGVAAGLSGEVRAAGEFVASPAVGEMAPEIEIEEIGNAPGGAVATMEALRGKVVVIEFWATWCAPCVAAFPHLNELVEHYKGSDDVVFLAITMETPEVARRLLDEKPLHAWQGFDTDNSVFASYGVNGIPRTIIIGKDGKIAADTMPMFLTTESIDACRAGKAIDLPGLADLAGAGGGEMGEPGGMGDMPDMPDMPGLPKTVEEMTQQGLEGTAPGPEHERLGALGGTWSRKSTFKPAGDFGPALESEVAVTDRWIQGGRVLMQTSAVDGAPGLSTHAYYGYDYEEGAYYLLEISPTEMGPVRWVGQWEEEQSRFRFTRTMEVRMMGGMGMQGDGDEAVTMEMTHVYHIEVGDGGSIRTKHSISLPGYAAAGAAQVVSESVWVRADL